MLDPSSLIPLSDKPEEDKKAILELGDSLCGSDATIYLSLGVLKVYRTVVMGKLERLEGSLPKFHRGLKEDPQPAAGAGWEQRHVMQDQGGGRRV